MLPEFTGPARGAVYMKALGFYVFPLTPNDKIPVAKGWQKQSLTFEEGTISSYVMGHGNEECNFGVHPPEDFFVVDIDNKKGHVAAELLAELKKSYGPIPPTLTVQTPTGGFHFYFKGKTRNTVGALMPGIDTRAPGGYVVCPGSVIDNRQYEIIDDSPVADAPERLINGLAKVPAPVKTVTVDIPMDLPGNVQSAVDYLEKAEPATEGENGDVMLFQIFAKLKDLGISPEQAKELVLAHYNDRCDPPWDMDNEDHATHFDQKLAQGWKTKNSPGSDTPEARLQSAKEDFTPLPIDPPKWLARIHPFNPSETFPDDAYFLFIGEQGIAETGDLVAIQAKTKAGKSAVIGAMLGAMMGGQNSDGDFLGFSGHNREQGAVLHFDTEQKPKDHHALIRLAIARAGLLAEPPWLHSFCIKSLSRPERVQAVEHYIREFSKTGKVKAVFIDGIADLCDDTNDKEKSEKLGERVVGWSQTYGCAVTVVLHENPSKESEKMRGHLGTYFEMKAEAVLRVEKDAKGTAQIWGERMRRGHIARGKGPSFQWDRAAGMHLSCESVQEVTGFTSEAVTTFLNKNVTADVRYKLCDLQKLALNENLGFAGTPSRTDSFRDNLLDLLGKNSAYTIDQVPKNRGTWFLWQTASPATAPAELDAVFN